MAISCSPDVFRSLEGIEFPADKGKLLRHASAHGASEAVVVALNQLEEGVYYKGIDEICSNVSIVCSLEVYYALEGLDYPADKGKILSYARVHDASEVALKELQRLPSGHAYKGIDEVCSNISGLPNR